MIINELHLTHWKGITGATSFSPITLICGPNGSGKSARLEAIRAAFLGYDPRLGKRNQDVFLYADGALCSVNMTGTLGKRSIDVTRTWKRVKGSVKAETEGDNLLVPPVAMDPEVYFGLSERERVKFVFDVCKPQTDPFILLLKKLSDIPCTEAQREFMGERADDVKRASLAPCNEAQPVSEALQDVIDGWSSQWSECSFVSKRALPPEPSAVPNIASLDKQLLEATQKQSALAQRVGGLIAQRDAVVRRNADITMAQVELRKVNSGSKDREQLEWTVAQLSKLPQCSPAVLADAKAKLAAAQRRRQDILADLEVQEDKLSALDEESENVSKKDCCPTCGESTGTWKRAYKAKVKGQRGELESIIAALVNQRSAEDKAIVELRTTVEKEADKCSIHAAQKAEYEAACLKLAQLPKAAPGLFELANEELGDVTEFEKQLTDAREQHRQAGIRVSELNDSLRQAEGNRAVASARMTAKAESEKAQWQAAILKQCLNAATEVKAALVEQTFGALLKTANAIAAPLIGRELEYKENEVGYTTKSGSWVSFKTLSGTEQAAAFAGISLALAAESSKVVLMDEVGRMTEDNKLKLLSTAEKMIQNGTLDQLILCDVEPINWVPSTAGLYSIVKLTK